MKTLSCLLLFIFILTVNCFSQESATDFFRINTLPAEGILLDKGWILNPGDNPEWAEPEYNDKGWQSINPTNDIHDLPELWKNNVVWFRLRFTVDSTINNPLALMIQQSGASELYLNGKLIRRFGVLSANPNLVKAFNPLNKPVLFPVSKAREQVLAVRYALQPHISYSTHFGTGNRGFSVSVNTIENANAQYQQGQIDDVKGNVFKVGVFLILGILYLAFYLFNRTQKVNLHFSLYAFLLAATWAVLLYSHSVHQIEQWFLINNFLLAIQVLAFFFLLAAIYNLFEQKKGWIYYSLFSLGVISIPLGAFIYGWGWLIFGILFTNSVNLVITYIAFRAVRNKKKGAWIIAAGGVCFLICWFIFTLQWQGFLREYGINFFDLAILSIPIAVSIYLGYDFALTYHSLQKKFTEVENLSKEKQQILEAQNETLEKQVIERTAELQNSIKELKETQAQLVQREKMASLGELTAGIAHEIQNPLNFVNNFSEVNKELVDEMEEALRKDDKEEAITIASDIKVNLEKINHHGKRADAIVKGMLQHSRISTGQKEPTNINALADEYLRLSYHGLRAKDKLFNATLQTDFDESIGKVNIVPQDMGRVLLNLFNNAFYAVTEKKKKSGNEYEPTVSVSTKKLNDKIEIRVNDNGVGVPQKVLDKIFQPFFTTKPTGHGTGLGLSLAYDIVTKEHGGQIKVESKEGEGAEFIINLPIR